MWKRNDEPKGSHVKYEITWKETKRDTRKATARKQIFRDRDTAVMERAKLKRKPDVTSVSRIREIYS
jgi:hypothetical protein